MAFGHIDLQALWDVMFPIVGTYKIPPTRKERFKAWIKGQRAQPTVHVIRRVL